MDGGKKKQFWIESDLYAVYGRDALSEPYETQVMLWLNIPRQLLRHGVSTQRGIHAAFSFDQLDRSYYEAAAAIPEQVDALRAQSNLQRVLAKMWAEKS